jgi:hypothetical protein
MEQGRVKKLICMAVILIALAGCLTYGELWQQVQEHYPACKDKPMPEIFFSEEMEERGMYIRGLHWVVLNPHTYDTRTIIHEFRHACGDDIGELPDPPRRIL